MRKLPLSRTYPVVFVFEEKWNCSARLNKRMSEKKEFQQLEAQKDKKDLSTTSSPAASFVKRSQIYNICLSDFPYLR